MKHSLAAGLILISSITGARAGDVSTSRPITPTTKILAIGSVSPGVDIAKVQEVLPREVRDTVELYLEGRIDQWYSRPDGRGVVFILNMTDASAAQALLEKLPLGAEHLMSFELIPIGPLNQLRRLPGMSQNKSDPGGNGPS